MSEVKYFKCAIISVTKENSLLHTVPIADYYTLWHNLYLYMGRVDCVPSSALFSDLCQQNLL